jgi:hypothetical protein
VPRAVPGGWAGAARTFLGLWLFTWRTQTALRRWPGLVVTVAGVPLLAWVTVDRGELRPFLQWATGFYLLLLVPLYCLFICGGMIREEVQQDTLSYWTTRRAGRGRLLATRLVCQLIWLQLVAGMTGVLLLAAGWRLEIPGIGGMVWVFLGVQFLAVLVFGALSTLAGLVSKRYIVLGILYGVVVEVGIGRIPTNINLMSMTRHLQGLLAFHPGVAEVRGWVAEGWIWPVTILLGATVLAGGAAALLFAFKEFQASEEMQG